MYTLKYSICRWLSVRVLPVFLLLWKIEDLINNESKIVTFIIFWMDMFLLELFYFIAWTNYPIQASESRKAMNPFCIVRWQMRLWMAKSKCLVYFSFHFLVPSPRKNTVSFRIRFLLSLLGVVADVASSFPRIRITDQSNNWSDRSCYPL